MQIMLSVYSHIRLSLSLSHNLSASFTLRLSQSYLYVIVLVLGPDLLNISVGDQVQNSAGGRGKFCSARDLLTTHRLNK